MIFVSVIVWLVVKRWWLGSLIAGLIAVGLTLPSLAHLTGAQRGTAFMALGAAFVIYGGATAGLYGLRYALTALWQAVKAPYVKDEGTAQTPPRPVQ